MSYSRIAALDERHVLAGRLEFLFNANFKYTKYSNYLTAFPSFPTAQAHPEATNTVEHPTDDVALVAYTRKQSSASHPGQTNSPSILIHSETPCDNDGASREPMP
jgi:hypothetical protein